MTERAAVYCRISEDPRQTEYGVERQREDCAALVKARGWELVGTWQDNDVAVLRPDAVRPEYAAMIAAAERGEITRIVAYGLSRLWRNRSERAQAIDRLKELRVSIALVKGQDLDLSSAAGRMYAGMLGEFDTAESELKAERVARAAQQRAEEGRASGLAPYGWQRVKVRNDRGEVIDWRDEIEPAEAKIVREIVDRLLQGDTIKAITTGLNDRGVPPPGANWKPRGRPRDPDAPPRRWLHSSVRKIALRPTNVALRVHRGEIIGPATWPPIIDRDRHDRVVALLSAPDRRTTRATTRRPGARRHLLSYGVGECGKCGGHLRVAVKSGHPLYVCDAPTGCTGRRQEWVDDLVERVVVRRLADPDARDLLTRDDGAARAAREHADGVRAKLDNAADDFAAGDLDREQLRRITARLRPELEAAERDAARAVHGVAPTLLAQLAGPHARKRWNGLTVAQQRALLEALEVRVRIMPARGGAGFKPESVQIAFGHDHQEVTSGATG